MSVSRGNGNVVLVDYPFTDRRGSKVRPAIVVQADKLNHQITDTILAANYREDWATIRGSVASDRRLP